MKIRCVCGELLSDNTDELPHKAHLVADEDWMPFTESCLRPQGYDWRLVTIIYQCPSCGRLLIEKPTGKVAVFKAEGQAVPKTLLRSVQTAGDDHASES